MNQNSKNPALKAILTKAVKAFDENGVLADYIENPDIDSGSEVDSLAAFIVREASDVFDPDADDEANALEIVRSLNGAIAQLQAVREAIAPCAGV